MNIYVVLMFNKSHELDFEIREITASLGNSFKNH